jgi:serine phosphatase RsbU (regulator of sigma subunit)
MEIASEERRLTCLEIRGGSRAVDEKIVAPGMRAHIVTRPYQGAQTGGDVHYMSACGMGHIARFVLADVSGHGVDATPIAEELFTLMRKHVNNASQADFGRALSAHLGEVVAGRAFATAVLATYFRPSRHLIVCNAGHPPPLLLRKGAKRWVEVVEGRDDLPFAKSGREAGVKDLPLGIIDPTEYTQFAVKLGEGDHVLLYTDGVIETRPAAGRMLGAEGLLDLLGRCGNPDEDGFTTRVMDELEQFRGGAPADDDVTLFLLSPTEDRSTMPRMTEIAKGFGRAIGLVAQRT